jgi:anti-sigma factor RsiW
VNDERMRRHLDGTLEPAEAEQLRRTLAEDPAQARRLFELAAERALLVDALAGLEIPARRTDAWSRRLAVGAAAAAACLALWFAAPRGPEPIAVPPGGTLEVPLGNGAFATFRGYARARRLPGGLLGVDAGSAVLRGSGVRVRTPHLDASLGTGRASIEVGEESTRIVVLEGTLSAGGLAAPAGDGVVADAGGVRGIVKAEGLLAWWPMDEMRDGRMADAAGLGLDAGIRGAVTSTEGIRGGAVEFQGDGPAWIESPHVAALDFGRPDAAFTWIAWVKTRRGGDVMGKPRHDVALSDSIPGYLHLSSGGRLHFYRWVEREGRLQSTHADAPAALDGDWHQLAYVQGGAARRALYLDATLLVEDREAWTQDCRNGSLFSLGYCHNLGLSGSRQFRGSLDEVRVYGRALASAEIGELHRRTRASR